MPEPLPFAFSHNLRTLRNKVSRKELAQILEIQPNTLRNYEEGLSLPNFELGLRISRHFGVSPEWLMHGEEDQSTTAQAPESMDSSVTPIEYAEERKLNRELVQENRELAKECRELLKENGDLRVQLEKEKSRSAPREDAPEGTRRTA
ncbi:MAG: helix-turn-helix domain-containing protein [Desulfovibrio sp.]